MPRPVRKGVINRIALLLLLVLVIALVGVWRFASLTRTSPQATPVAGNRSGQDILDKVLLDAIRDGDKTKVQQLLQDGANVNARDDAGDTALDACRPGRGRGDDAHPC